MTCAQCGKPLSFNEMGLNRKLNANAEKLCMACMAVRLNVGEERLREKIGEYLAAGCLYFAKEDGGPV